MDLRPAIWDQEGWRADAACQQVPTDVFFPVGQSARALAETDRAKRLCGGCEVRDECLAFAVTTNQEYGIWGGLDEEERRLVRRRWRAAQRKRAQLLVSV